MRIPWLNNSERLLKLLPCLLLIIGIALVFAPKLYAHALWPSLPASGKLVPKQNLVTWRSPDLKTVQASGSGKVPARFEVVNIGRSLVRILGADTSCGCATPTIPPTFLIPEAASVVDVRAASIQAGSKDVTIALRTDSLESPKVILRADEGVRGADGEAKILLISRFPATDLRIQEDANPASPFRIGRLQKRLQKRGHSDIQDYIRMSPFLGQLAGYLAW